MRDLCLEYKYRAKFLFVEFNPENRNISIQVSYFFHKNFPTGLFSPPQAQCCQGVDLNRNFDWFFGQVGSSSDPCSEIYAVSEKTFASKIFIFIRLKTFSAFRATLRSASPRHGRCATFWPNNMDGWRHSWPFTGVCENLDTIKNFFWSRNIQKIN